MRFRIFLFGLAILTLASGLFLFAVTTVREIDTGSSTTGIMGLFPKGVFVYGAATLTPDNPPQVVIGTSGIADLMILTAPGNDFNNWVCNSFRPN